MPSATTPDQGPRHVGADPACPPLANGSHGDAKAPIAIIGMSCRLPGEATSPEKLWKLCAEGRSAWSEIPGDRFNKEAFYHPCSDKRTTANVTGGHFLKDDIGLFDANFFNLTPDVAATMDPQCRMQLESVYEALESAGITLEKVAGSETAVFAGAFFKDYMDSLMRDPDTFPRYVMTGNGATMMSNRISHFYDLRGPSMTVDTGCSTGLVALHQACQSLRTGDAKMAIVGGANVMINPDIFILMSSLGFLSPDGKSYAFDSRASGYGRGEGVGTIILKPLQDALRDGDPIRAVVRQTALNQDGKTQTITSPSQAAQEDLIRRCYKSAGLDPADTDYVEAHGTGTQAGDPVEAGALHAIMGKGRPVDRPLYIGSVKTNVGHTETASGFASIIKVVLALEKGHIPPSINFEKGSEKIPFEAWNLKVPRHLQPWPADVTRRASINNFGYGGANAHVIMEAWEPHAGKLTNGSNGVTNGPNGATNGSNGVNNGSNGVTNGSHGATLLENGSDTKSNGNTTNGHLQNGAGKKVSSTNGLNGLAETPVLKVPYEDGFSSDVSTNGFALPNGLENGQDPGSRVFLLTAKDETVARTMVENLKQFVAESSLEDGQLLDRLAYTLSERRSRFLWATATASRTREELLASLDATKLVPTRSTAQPRLGFVFTGQGAQWYAMGRELIGVYPVFTDTLYEADQYLRQFGCPWSLIDELTKDEKESRINDVVVSPPLCIAVQIALARLLASWGIKPTAITSHSSGEVAAAYAAGVLSLQEAMAIVYARGEYLDALQTRAYHRGAMMAVGLGREEAESYVSKLTSGKVVVACVNSPSSVTISGDQAAIAELEQKLTEEKVFARALKVPVAYHSHHMNTVADDYLKALRKNLRKERTFEDVVYTSPVTGDRIVDASEMGPEHWVRNMLQPVEFVDALRKICLDPSAGGRQVDMLVEIGPHGALAGPIRQCLQLPELSDLGVGYGSCLSRGKNAVDTMHALAVSLVAKGYPVDLSAVNFPRGSAQLGVIPELPTYPWNHRTRHWWESRINRDHRQRKEPAHELLGSTILGLSPSSPAWRHIIRASDLPWVRDHRLQSDIVYPGAGLVVMAIEAMRQVSHGAVRGFSLRDVDIMAALVIPDTPDGVEVQLHLHESDGRTLGLEGYRPFSICSTDGEGAWTEHCRGLISAVPSDREHQKTVVAPGDYTVEAKPDDIFDFFQSVGIYHGPAFRNLKQIMSAPGRSATTFAVADTTASMPGNFQREHLLHPTTLDSVFQAAYSALPSGQRCAMVPRSIKKMFVSADIRSEAAELFVAHSRIGKMDRRGFHAHVAVQSEGGADSSAVLEIEDLFCQALDGTVAQAEQHSGCLTVQWEEELSLTSARGLMEKLKASPDPSEVALVQEMKQACFYFFHDTVGSLTESDVGGLLWYHKIFFEWMKLQISQQPQAAKWLEVPEAEKENLFGKVSSSSVDGEMVCRIGCNLAPILRQQIAPLELMLQDHLLYRYYKSALRVDRCYAQVHHLVKLFAHKNPRAKVLEIGAGTGGCTQSVLEALGGGDTGTPQRFSRYDFTDISSGFFEQARTRFGAWGTEAIQYQKLDVESDPADQGFEKGSYDLIVACQVLHATKNMDRTMRHVRSLLRPGGKLIMVETTHDIHDIQLIFGVLPGWWLSEEPERKHSPSLTVDLWSKVLQRTGFSGLDVQVKDCEDDENYVMNTLMTTALPDSPKAEYPDTVITFSQENPPPQAWLQKLQETITTATSTEPAIDSLDVARPDGKICVFVDNPDASVLVQPSEEVFAQVKQLAIGAKGLLWVSRGGAVDCENPMSALHTGFLRTLRCEDSSKRYISLDLEHGQHTRFDQEASAVAAVLREAFDYSRDASTIDFEYAARGDSILIPRVHQDQTETEALHHADADATELQPFGQPGRELRLGVAAPGMLDSLVFSDDPDADAPLPGGFVEIEPRAFGVNFRDVMVAMGQLEHTVMGFECSGVVSRLGPDVPGGLAVGDRVCALLRGHWASRARVHWTSVARMPGAMTFEVGASLPVVFVTAYHAINTLARLQKNEKVLIHSAAGGVGQAAIMLAKLVGAEVFATVGSSQKRDFIEREYGIPQDHIFSSRDASFSQAIMEMTNGAGVDVVLNSLAGQLLHETWSCIAPFGRFVEIGKRDFEQNNNLQMSPFTRATSFFAVDLIMLGELKGDVVARALTAVMDMFREGSVRPIAPITTYPISELETAFRTMQAGKHLGKLVVVPHDNDLVKARKRTLRLSPEAAYAVVGGTGGLGRSIIRRLAERGAKNVLVLSRHAESHSNAPFLDEMRSKGVNILARNLDICNPSSLAEAIEQASNVLPPVKGVIQGAMVLQDSIVEHMSHQDFVTAVRPKVQGTWNLHRQFASSKLDFFVMLSSLTGVAGNSSQANYAAGGTFQDALARHLASNGLAGVSLDLGMVSSVGYVAETEGVAERLRRQGYSLVQQEDVLALIENAILNPVRQSRSSQVLIGFSADDGGDHASPWKLDPRFKGLSQLATAGNRAREGANGDSLNLADTIGDEKASWDDVVEAVCNAIVVKLSRMFALPPEEVDKSASMAHYGVDSLVAVELRNWFSSVAQSEISIFDIIQSKSLVTLATTACLKSRLVGNHLKTNGQ
ncbi:Type I Iterative PKS [Neofusicoccum ribis]|uniref:Type I Iterative PKS n=1 Tax=Neofusicoccum ribis TaxID=45134 RepID=A0ABR3SL24_9PEZI